MSHIEEVANRLKGLRDALGLTIAEMASACSVDEELYEKFESAEADIPVSTLHRMARVFGVEITALMFGEEPKMNSYFVTRKGCGVSVERRNWYKYQSLAAGFANRAMEPFLVTVDPDSANRPVNLSPHDGQEFNYIESGCMELHVGGNVIELHEGDTIMFDARRPHGMRALGGTPLKFIAIII